MPWSETALRPWIAGQLTYFADLQNVTAVTDVGTGAGTAPVFYRPFMLGSKWTGIEIHEPYARQFNLAALYDTLVIADARTLEPFPAADITFMADVLEHMEPPAALKLWHKARGVSKWLVASMPLKPYPQGALYGNKHETHLHDWEPGEALEAFAGVVSMALPPPGHSAGAFIARGLA